MKPSLAFLKRFDFFGILMLRIGAGTAIAFRGFPLLLAGPEEWSNIGRAVGLIGIEGFYLLFGLLAVILESFGGVAVVLGLLTRSMALSLAIIMAFVVATMINHSEELFHILLAAQLGLTFLAIVFIGPGRVSLDRKGV